GTIFRSLDVSLLSPEKKARFREIMLTPELQPGALAQADPGPLQAPGLRPASPDVPDSKILPTAGKASAGDMLRPKTVSPEENFAEQVQAMQDIQFQKLREMALEKQREAGRCFASDSDRAIEILEDFLSSLTDSQLDPKRVALLRRPVESRLQQFKMLKTQRELVAKQTGQRDTFNKMKSREALTEENKQNQDAELSNQFQSFT